MRPQRDVTADIARFRPFTARYYQARDSRAHTPIGFTAGGHMRQAWTLLTNGFDADAAPRRHHAVSAPPSGGPRRRDR